MRQLQQLLTGIPGGSASGAFAGVRRGKFRFRTVAAIFKTVENF